MWIYELIFETFCKVFFLEFGINAPLCVSLSGFTWQFGLKNPDFKLQTLHIKKLTSSLGNIVRGGKNRVMGDRCIKPDKDRKILYFDANNWSLYSLSESLPYDEIKFDENVILEDISNTPDNSHIGYFVEVDFKCPDNKKENN